MSDEAIAVGTLASELAPMALRSEAPRVYADANVPNGIVAYMRTRLAWDVLFVIEHDDLRRARHRALSARAPARAYPHHPGPRLRRRSSVPSRRGRRRHRLHRSRRATIAPA